jgi:DNA invertase Pin-like site-specific DNA recombinase
MEKATLRNEAIAYVRVASLEQADQKRSINGQQTIIENFCRENNIALKSVFQDAGTSGNNFRRPGWKDLEKHITDPQNGIELLIVISYDRISRSIANVREKINFLERKHNVSVFSLTPNNDINNKLL